MSWWQLNLAFKWQGYHQRWHWHHQWVLVIIYLCRYPWSLTSLATFTFLLDWGASSTAHVHWQCHLGWWWKFAIETSSSVIGTSRKTALAQAIGINFADSCWKIEFQTSRGWSRTVIDYPVLLCQNDKGMHYGSNFRGRVPISHSVCFFLFGIGAWWEQFVQTLWHQARQHLWCV